MYQQICAYELVYPACKILYNIYCTNKKKKSPQKIFKKKNIYIYIAEIGKVFVFLHMNYKYMYKCDNDRKITYVHCMYKNSYFIHTNVPLSLCKSVLTSATIKPNRIKKFLKMHLLVRTFYSCPIHSQGCIDIHDCPEEKNAQ